MHPELLQCFTAESLHHNPHDDKVQEVGLCTTVILKETEDGCASSCVLCGMWHCVFLCLRALPKWSPCSLIMNGMPIMASQPHETMKVYIRIRKVWKWILDHIFKMYDLKFLSLRMCQHYFLMRAFEEHETWEEGVQMEQVMHTQMILQLNYIYVCGLPQQYYTEQLLYYSTYTHRAKVYCTVLCVHKVCYSTCTHLQ